MNRQTEGWVGPLTDDLNRYSFEGADGATVSSIGDRWMPAPSGTTGGTITTAKHLLGSSAAWYRSAFTKPRCTAGGGGVSLSSNLLYANYTKSPVTSIYFGVYVQWDPYIGWPDEFQKIFMFPNGGFLLQPANGMRTSPSWMPSTFMIWSDGNARASTFRINPDGGPLEKQKWYWIDGFAKITSPTSFVLRVNGVEVYNGAPFPVNPGNDFMHFGLINACGSKTWGLDTWLDGLVYSSRPVYAFSEIYICPDASTVDMTQCVWQFPTTISDQSNMFSVRLKGSRVTLRSGVVYVRIRNQERNLSAPVALTVTS